MDRGGWTCKIINLIGYKVNGDLVSNVGINKCKAWMVDDFFDVNKTASHEVIDADNLVAFVDEAITQV